MSVRLRRLKADYDRLSTIFTQTSRIRIKKTFGNPPEKYQLEYLVQGMEKTLDGKLRLRSNFMIEITLTGAYPRMAPQCKMLTPVFHPNIAPHAICIGDHWAAGESLSNLVVRVAEMLSYQSYNTQSPLNGEAAKWALENKAKLPLDKFDYSSMLSLGEAVSRNTDGSAVAGDTCANCGKKSTPDQMTVCAGMHVSCAECLLECPVCHQNHCLKCALVSCSSCKRFVCTKCSYRCASCSQTVCREHAGGCVVCAQHRCQDCLVPCAACGQSACLDHVKKVPMSDGSNGFACATCIASAAAQTPG
jgi:ubiquitin-protein ligase